MSRNPPPPIWRRLARIAILILLAYTGVVLVMTVLQRSLIYPARKEAQLSAPSAFTPGISSENVRTTTADQIVLNGWLFRHSEVQLDRPLIIFLHGNGGNRSHRLDDVDLLTELGADVLLFDYRGYGDNAGHPSESGLMNDARAIWKYATEEMAIPPENIILFGESLGGGVATQLAAELSRSGTLGRGMIIRSSFTSLVDTAAYHYPLLPVRWVLWDRFESARAMPDVEWPICILHGDQDRVVPFSSGQKLFAAAPARSANNIPKRFVVLEGADHNDIFIRALHPMTDALRHFLQSTSEALPR